MIINTIVNRDVANLQDCESEPIHVPGSIQPHGFLLALDDTLRVVYCSENCAAFIGIPVEKILTNRFGAIFSNEREESLKIHLRDFSPQNPLPFILDFQNVKYNCTLQPTGNLFLFEAEPFPDGQMLLPDLYVQTRNFVNYLQEAASLQALSQLIATETRAITGYDRVMIYKFDEHYNGEVIAESKRDDLEPFLGLHYPHTDIPAQARELYLRNLMRMIADVYYTPVPICTVENRTHRDLDLSLSVLRSVSPIHIEYLKNMGVGATLTISLINNGRLWGLISCHHYSPKNLPHYTRFSALMQGHFLTSQINVRQQAEEYALAKSIEHILEVILSLTNSEQHNFLQNLLSEEHILKVVNATGFAILHADVLYLAGVTPTDGEIRGLIEALSADNLQVPLHTNRLIDLYPASEHFTDKAAGIIYHPFGQHTQDCILWFRPESPLEVNWAGEPEKSIEHNPNGLSPRKSFALWQQIKKFESRPWEKPEVTAASTVSYALQKQIHFGQLAEEKQKLVQLSEKLRSVVAELENINWISTHDLKEPLRKIQTFASRILEDENHTHTPMVIQSVQRMNDAAVRMQTLIHDLVSYTHVNKLENNLVPTDLNAVLDEVSTELHVELEEKKAVIDSDLLPQVLGVAFLLQQLFLNLVRNSIKFSKKDLAPHIQIRTTTIEKVITEDNQLLNRPFHKISFIDNGVGFDNQYASQIFDVFKRVHNASQYQGTGIGLAICKKIMQNHNGFIDATSEKNIGTTINLYFPQAL
ncbi:ATP-binding protein [Runella sp.]|uniref:ATP-binding protein n=1 Tax=Runella sp. TaxID=1960881 RepID=UPI003D0D6CEC